MDVVAFIEPRAPGRSDGRGDVIEKILRHCGLSHCSRAPPAGEDFVHDPEGVCSDPIHRGL